MTAEVADLKLVYLIFGSEDLLLQQAVDRLKKTFASVGDLDFNLDVFDGGNAAADAVVAAANTLPFMSERRLVILRSADSMSTDDLNVLADYCADPNPETTLVLVAKKIAKNMRIYKAIDKLGGAAEYKAPKKHEYPVKVTEMFAEKGKRVGVDAAEVLVRAVGHDLRRLAIEIDKVIAFTGEETTLSRHEIESVMSTTAPTSIFDFLDSLGSRDSRQALKLLADMLAEGESIYGIEAMTMRHLRSLISVRALLDRGSGTSHKQIASEIGAAPWQIRNLARQAGYFSEQELTKALRSVAAADAKMKTGQDSRLVFERWVVEVCAA